MKKKMTKAKFNIHVLIYALVIFIILGMTTGFALYNKLINLSGTLSISKMGRVIVSNVVLVESENTDTTYTPTYTEDSIDFNTRFVNSDSSLDCYAIYDVYLTNNASIESTLSSLNLSNLELTSSVENDTATIETTISGNVGPGYVFAPGETAIATVTIRIVNATDGATYDVGGDAGPESNPGSVYSINAGIEDPKTGDLTGSNVRAPFTLDVISTYEESTQFVLSLSSSNYKIVDSNGNDWGTQTIAANSEDSYVFYIEVIDPTKVTTNSQTLGVYISSNGSSKFVDNVVLAVDKYEEAVDEDAPVISNLSFTQSNNYDNRGQGTLSWVGSDDSSITSYTIIKYEKLSNSNNFTSTTIPNVSSNTYNFTDLVEDATYYFKVYGIDEHGNTASSEEINSNTSNTHCAMTSQIKCEWIFNVTFNLSDMTSNGSNTAYLGQSYSCTLQVSGNNNWRYMPNSITVRMNGEALSSGSDYTYNNNNGAVTINNVTGEIVIEATASCLIEGTKIRLYDGRYKNIENIEYDDLLAVWSYDEGKIVPDYPIWIEKETKVNTYQLTTFEDGSELKTYGFHGIFDINLNEFISVDDTDKFKIGTEIAKIDENGNIYSAKVKSIEYINEETNYYNVMSTKYFNIIANDCLVTDGTVIFSNIFGFDENITWPKSRYEIISNSDNLFDESIYNGLIPSYLVSGLRAIEAKVICDNGFMTIEELSNYLIDFVSNKEMIKNPIQDEDGNNLWMMTTSIDDINPFNKRKFLHKEGSIFELPKVVSKDGKTPYWYNAVRNEYYEGGEKIKVDYSMHFELIFK